MAGPQGASKSVSPMIIDESNDGEDSGDDSGAEQADDEHEDGEPQAPKVVDKKPAAKDVLWEYGWDKDTRQKKRGAGNETRGRVLGPGWGKKGKS